MPVTLATLPPIVFVMFGGGCILLLVLAYLFRTPKVKKPVDSTIKTESKAPAYSSTYGSHTCTHGPFGAMRFLTIKGKQVGVGASPFCEKCTTEYFEKYSRLCDVCGDVICPGMPVGQHYTVKDGKEILVTNCQKMDCCLPGDLCGQWGEGKINEMNWGCGGKTRPKKEEPKAEPIAPQTTPQMDGTACQCQGERDCPDCYPRPEPKPESKPESVAQSPSSSQNLMPDCQCDLCKTARASRRYWP